MSVHKPATAWKTALLATALMSVGASAQQDERDATRLANMGAHAAAPVPVDGGIAAALAQWRAIGDTSQLPFDSYAGFLLAHRGWPNEASIRRAAEAKAGTAPPANVVSYFRAFAPLTAGGRAAFARALWSTGAADAGEAARAAWRGGALAPADESWLLATVGARLTPDDHDTRMDALLWAGQTGAAARQIGYVSPTRRAAFQARLALRTNAPDAAGLATGADGALATDAGYLADKANWLKNADAWPSARSLLAQRPRLAAPPSDPEGWMEVLLTNARGAAGDGNWQQAYDIARRIDDVYPAGTDVATRPYGERDDYTSLAWLAAQAAFRHLARPADAMTLFDAYAHGTPTPSTRSKGLYWAARAADAAGRSPEAAGYWTAAANFRDAYYGQLANEHLSRQLVAPPPVVPVAVDPLVRTAFGNRDAVRAARLLGNIGAYEDQSAFVRQIALDAKTQTDHLLADDLARELQRPDLGVMVGRSALLNGLTDYSAAGFPTVPVPAGYEGDWTIIHAIARQESQFNRAAISHAGARGLMQLMPGTAREQAGKAGISYQPAELTTNPDLSMMLGSGYFRRVYAIYGSYPLAIAAYNAGPGNVNKWLRANGDPRTGGVDAVDWVEAIPIQETRNYVQRVLENAVVYDLLRPERALSRGPANLSWYLGRRAS